MIRTSSTARAATLGIALLCISSETNGQEGAVTIGQPAPEFTLLDTNGDEHSLNDFRGEWVVLEWLNYGCPYVRKHYDSGNMQGLQQRYGELGVKWFAIVSSAPGKQGYYPPAEMNLRSAEIGNNAHAVLLDPDGTVGYMYDAKTTPHMFVVNPDGVLLYNGAIDDKPSSRATSLEGAHNYVAAALDEALSGRQVSVSTSQPYGCSVKY
jgi:cytochrome oxidase Cu insertion factor (SCO1/SenC/PrrC family)